MNQKPNPNGANLIIYRFRDGVLEILLQKSVSRKPRNFWELPGGGVEPVDENSFCRAAVRETSEEIGWFVRTQDCILIASLIQKYRLTDSSFGDGNLEVFCCEDEDIEIGNLVLQKDEVDKVRWWPIITAMFAEDNEDDDFVSVAHRRMLAMLFNKMADNRSSIHTGWLRDPVPTIFGTVGIAA